jgi:hypothetical protein
MNKVMIKNTKLVLLGDYMAPYKKRTTSTSLSNKI